MFTDKKLTILRIRKTLSGMNLFCNRMIKGRQNYYSFHSGFISLFSGHENLPVEYFLLTSA